MPPHTPPQSPYYKRYKASTRSKTRFFNIYNTRQSGYKLKDVVYYLNLQPFNQYTFHQRTYEHRLRQRRVIN
jgi:hypothetical protein